MIALPRETRTSRRTPLKSRNRGGHIPHHFGGTSSWPLRKRSKSLLSQHSSTAIELLPAGVRVRELDVPKKIVAEFLADVMPLDRADRFIQALEVGVFCLERAEAARDLDFVRGQVESILQEVTRQVGAVPQLLEAGLAEKLRAEDGQLLAPIKVLVEGTARTLTERVSSVRDLLANDMDPAKSTSTLGRALAQLKDMLDGARTDSIQGTVAEAIKSVTGEDGTLAKSVKATVAEAIRPLADEVNRIGLQIAANIGRRGSDRADRAQRHSVRGATGRSSFSCAPPQWAPRWRTSAPTTAQATSCSTSTTRPWPRACA